MADFECSVTVNCSIDQAFSFLIRPANAVKFSPPDLGLVLIDAPEILQTGSRIEFKIQTWGQVQHLVHEITTVTEPTRFIETQVRGPFKKWVHTHLLEAAGPEKVVITDQIEFDPPGGLIGLMVTRKKVLEHLEDGFLDRHERLVELLEQNA